VRLNPFRDFLDWLTRDNPPTIRTSTEPARVNVRARRNNVTVPNTLRVDMTAVTAAAEAMRRHGEEMRRAGIRSGGTRFPGVAGRGVSINNDNKGSHITVNGRTIDVTPDGRITIDGQQPYTKTGRPL
jgi:hypothetical protein